MLFTARLITRKRSTFSAFERNLSSKTTFAIAKIIRFIDISAKLRKGKQGSKIRTQLH